MSWYATYYLGIRDKNGKIKPFGPYDNNGELKDVLCKSRSFASDLWEDFLPVLDDVWTPELEKEFSYEDYEGKTKRNDDLRYLPSKELPKGDYIKSGYYLIDDIDRYIKSKTDPDIYFDDFYDFLTQEAYVRKLDNELKFGTLKKQVNEYGEEYTEYSCADYSYFCYPDYQCKEYECFKIREAIDIMDPYNEQDVVVLLITG